MDQLIAESAPEESLTAGRAFSLPNFMGRGIASPHS